MKILVLSLVFLSLSSFSAYARFVQGATDVRKTTAPSFGGRSPAAESQVNPTPASSEAASGNPTATWQGLKNKVGTWFNSFTVPLVGRKPASEEAGTPPATDSLPKVMIDPHIEVLKSQNTARPADPTIRKSAAGVPTFEIMVNKTQRLGEGKSKKISVHVDKIPLLNIGVEESLVAADFGIPELRLFDVSHIAIHELATPPLTSEKDINGYLIGELAQAPLKLYLSFLEGEQVVTRERVDAVKWLLDPVATFAEFTYKPLTADDYVALKAFILFDKKDQCHLATGFLYTLLESKNSAYSTAANLDLGVCLHDMGLFTESVHRLLEVIRNKTRDGDREKVTRAIDKLVTDLPVEFELDVSRVFRKVDPAAVSEKAKDAFHYIQAKGAALDGDFHSAETFASLVTNKFSKYDEAQYLVAVAEYVNGNAGRSIQRQRELLDRVEKNGKRNDLVSLIAMNLGRTSFQNKNYDEAANYFMRIRKDNSFWVNALVEQGWAQLQKNDAEGAIGNMYSIHSPFFKSVYKPESYVVRTIGYLNICQFGDAYKTLTQLENLYHPLNENMKSYLGRNVGPTQLYTELVSYLRAPASANANALPPQILREIGHSREYLNLQEAINAKVDEGEQYNFLTGLIDKDREKVKWRSGKAQERILETELQITKSQKETSLLKNVPEWKSQIALDRDYIEFFRFKISIMEESKRGMIRFRDFAKVKLNTAKDELKVSAGKVLLKKLVALQKELNGILDNNELLRYETFAGSGENIRFHLGEAGNLPSTEGGKTATTATKNTQRRIAADVKPKSKSLQWDFDGEYWEDEIGNYRSSLKNNCPKNKASAMNK